MNSREKTSLLVSGLAITSGVLSAYLTGGVTLIKPEFLAEGLKALGGVGGNLVANALQAKIIDKHPQEDVLKNGDLTRAIGSAIFKICGELAEDTDDKYDKQALEKLAATPPEDWENLIIGGGYEEGYGLSLSNIDLDAVSSEKSVQYVHAQAGKLDEIEALTPQIWQNIIAALYRKKKYSLSQSAKENLAAKLHKEFARALRKVLIADFAADGKAYASMQFRILGEILKSLNEIRVYSRQNYEQSEAILALTVNSNKKIEELSAKIAGINQNSPSHYSPGNKKDWEKIFKDFESFRKTLDETYQNTEDIKTTQTEHGRKLDRIIETQTEQSNAKNTKPKGLINVSKDGKAFFMEQGTVLRDLERQLKSRHIACLHGKHGLGKTTNAQEFARRQSGNYELIVFLSAAEKILETSIIDFADNHIPDLRKLSLLERQQVKPEAKFALFRDFFEDERLWQGEKRGWLLIFDNLESKEQIRRYFPNTNNGDILYTCNDDLYLDERCEVPIHEFSPAEAELFLYKRSDERKNASRADIPPETLADIRKILNDYGRLPFVLNKFRVYLSEIPISYAAFYAELKNNEKRYLELPASNDKYQYKNEIIAYSTSFEKIKPRENQSAHDRIISRLAVAMLNVSAFCFADRIPGEILKETLFRLVDTPETTASNETLFFEAFRLLQRFDLLNSKNEIFDYVEKKQTPEIVYLPFKKEETVYQSHRTIQKIVRLNLESEAKKEILNEIISVFTNLIPESNLENWKIFEKYLSSAENIVEEARKLELATVELGHICNEFGLYQKQLAQYQNAIKFYQEAIEIAEKTIGKEHPSYAIRLNNLAGVYRSQGRYEEAIELFKQALEIDEKTIGKEHPAYAIRLNNLASVYNSQGRYEEAIELYKQAIEIDEKTIGKEHPDYAIDLNNLASVYKSQGRYEEAIELYKQAIEIDEKTIGKEHPDYATDLNNLAGVYYSQGRYEEALSFYEESLGIYENTLPENHPYTVQTRENAAECRAMLEK